MKSENPGLLAMIRKTLGEFKLPPKEKKASIEKKDIVLRIEKTLETLYKIQAMNDGVGLFQLTSQAQELLKLVTRLESKNVLQGRQDQNVSMPIEL